MSKKQSKKVYVGLSGGVDSSVAALLLKQQGYDVVGAHMKNWTKSLPGFACPWREDYQDAKRVAVQLGIPFELFDFEQQYFDKVVQYMLDEFKRGVTPNPDVMCNQEIKFKLFLNMALDRGADFIATGHYAAISHQPSAVSLSMAKDANKDQTYFLYRVTEKALKKTLFPLGDLTKKEVRGIAKKAGLVTADKKESMGICFVGKVGIKEFLSQYIETKPGKIKDQNGVVLGEHDGAIFYTIGQRNALGVGGGLPYYVTGKNMTKNEVYVTSQLDDPKLWLSKVRLNSIHLINHKLPTINHKPLLVRTRHRGPLVPAKLEGNKLIFDEPQRALTPGQSAVFYNGQICLGGGIIT
jgi:tRNA-specific 2-thiouridylase